MHDERDVRIVLASGSAVRAQMLRNAGISFSVDPPDVDESVVKVAGKAAGKSVAEVAEDLARAKAAAGVANNPGAMVIAADQMLEFEGRWLDKPLNQAEGAARLREFSGKEHRLITAVVLQQDGNVLLCRTDFAVLRARDLSDGFIAGYVSTMGDEICRSVGGYRLEGLGAQLFEHVDGDFFTILGLSLLPLMAALRENGALSA